MKFCIPPVDRPAQRRGMRRLSLVGVGIQRALLAAIRFIEAIRQRRSAPEVGVAGFLGGSTGTFRLL
jgi:hypothetical protein